MDLDAYQEVATSFCADDWNTILSNLKYVSGKDYLYTYCYAASEEIQLLKSLGFDATQNNITAVDKINGQTVDWAFGVLIEKAGSQTP